ncbi:hypothetical protein CR513_26957, partial [Mucuna pruriens]
MKSSQLRSDASQLDEADFVMPTLSSAVKMPTLEEPTLKADSVPRWEVNSKLEVDSKPKANSRPYADSIPGTDFTRPTSSPSLSGCRPQIRCRLPSRIGSIPASVDQLHFGRFKHCQSLVFLHAESVLRSIRMTRKRNSGSLHPFDPEIEKTLNRIKKSKNMHVGHSSDSFSSITEIDSFEIKPNFADNPLY